MTYQDWLERYRRAWIERDADAAALLFATDALYREQAFAAPFSGRDAIRDYWFNVTRAQSDVDLRYGTPIADGRRVAVEWWATLLNDGAPLSIAGEFLLLFNEDGLCRELREYWVVKDAKVSPPAGWGT